jgi:hypothetical protein
MASPSQIVDKHLTTVVNCLLNVVYVMILVHFLDSGVAWICVAAKTVSPAGSWMGFAYNMWFAALVSSMMLAFRGTLEALILFDNFKRVKDGNKETITRISVVKTGVQIHHVDNGSTNTSWQSCACFIINGFLKMTASTAEDEIKQDDIKQDELKPANEDELKPANEDELKPANEDEIKQDAASAASSARSTADTSELD